LHIPVLHQVKRKTNNGKKFHKKTHCNFDCHYSCSCVYLIHSVTKARFTSNYPNTGNEEDTEYPLAPDFVGIEKWINSEPLKIEDLRGKVVLVDFWTYTCINCIRTLPYIKEWDKKYRDKGLVIVGVHTPEFEFEKKYENVLNAVKEYELKYPIAQDNLYATWSVWQNRYWPHKFLIDADGYVRYDHIGEGGYDETERMIQKLTTSFSADINIHPRIISI
jgi:thiol-disulfide isomerase/thioredoxin